MNITDVCLCEKLGRKTAKSIFKKEYSERQKPRHFLMQKTRQRRMQFGAQMLTTKLPDISDYASIALISQAIFCCTIKMAHV